MLQPKRDKIGWKIRDKSGKLLASLSEKGRFWGDVTYWPALLDAAVEDKYLIRNVDGWKEVEGSRITYRDYPFARFFTYRRPSGWIVVTEGFTGMQYICGGFKSVAHKRRCALALIRERGERNLVASIRKGIKQSGVSPAYENIYIRQYLRGWESTLVSGDT